MENKKKLAAAITAVSMYIQTEEEAVIMSVPQASTTEPVRQPPSPPVPFNAWALSGRQTQMQMNSMMLMKAYHGFKVR